MEVLTVVRIERRGRGIFRPTNKSIYKYRIANRTYNRHNGGGFPLPSCEGLDMYRGGLNWFCAYKTVEQFQEWVKQDEIEFFVSKGFRVLMLEVTDYQEGRKQVIYTKESIKKTTDITNIFI